jgi:hypothetical protein
MSDDTKSNPKAPSVGGKASASTAGSGLVLQGITQAEAAAKKNPKGLPPVHLWHPEFCGELDIHIKRDGSWHYMGSPIGRERLVRLFSTVLRYDDDERYYLVTPVEKIGIKVDDVPFVIVAMSVAGEGEEQVLTFTTNVGDDTIAGPDAPIRFEVDDETGEPAPYILVRARLEGLINRAVFYDLVALGQEKTIDGKNWFGVWSSGTFFPFVPADELQF